MYLEYSKRSLSNATDVSTLSRRKEEEEEEEEEETFNSLDE